MYNSRDASCTGHGRGSGEEECLECFPVWAPEKVLSHGKRDKVSEGPSPASISVLNSNSNNSFVAVSVNQNLDPL